MVMPSPRYGYLTMFAVAFPLAPALCLLNNVFEVIQRNAV
jgi:hypothetical protein